jgi:hypothetical protein
MGIVDFFQHQRIITEEEAERLRGAAGNINKPTNSKPKGITIADVLSVFPGSKIVAVAGLPFDDVVEGKPKVCKRCGDNKHARIVRRVWPDGRWDWCCHACGREAKK